MATRSEPAAEGQKLRFQIGSSKPKAGILFDLSREEILRISQLVTSSTGLKFSKHVLAFTEQGVAMLSSVLRSERAIQVNIAIMRAFVKLSDTLATNRQLVRHFAELERRVGRHDEQIAEIIDAIRADVATQLPHLRETVKWATRLSPKNEPHFEQARRS